MPAFCPPPAPWSAAVGVGMVRCPSFGLKSKSFRCCGSRFDCGAAVAVAVAVAVASMSLWLLHWIHFELASLCHVCAFGIAAHVHAHVHVLHMCARSRLIAALARCV